MRLAAFEEIIANKNLVGGKAFPISTLLCKCALGSVAHSLITEFEEANVGIIELFVESDVRAVIPTPPRSEPEKTLKHCALERSEITQ